MKKFNINEFIWFITLILLWCTIFFLYKSSMIYNYVNVRSDKFIIAALVVLGIICLVQMTKIVTFPTRQNIKVGNFIFILALILILINKGEYTSSFIEFRGITLVGSKQEEEHHEHKGECFHKNNNIRIQDNLHEFIQEYNENPQTFEGKDIEIDGLLYMPKELKGSFIIAKQEMNCCAADAVNIGIVCKGEVKYNKDSWIKVKGKITKGSIDLKNQSGVVPVIEVKEVYNIDKNTYKRNNS